MLPGPDPRVLADPQQGGLGIAADGRLHQLAQSLQQAGLRLHRRLASTASGGFATCAPRGSGAGPTSDEQAALAYSSVPLSCQSVVLQMRVDPVVIKSSDL